MKSLRVHRDRFSILFAMLLLIAFGGKELHMHSMDYYEAIHEANERAAEGEETLINRCNICSFESLLYTEQSAFECQWFALQLLDVFESPAVAEAWLSTTTASLRAPPVLS